MLIHASIMFSAFLYVRKKIHTAKTQHAENNDQQSADKKTLLLGARKGREQAPQHPISSKDGRSSMWKNHTAARASRRTEPQRNVEHNASHRRASISEASSTGQTRAEPSKCGAQLGMTQMQIGRQFRTWTSQIKTTSDQTVSTTQQKYNLTIPRFWT